MINKQENEYSLENIYRDLESGMPENKSIKEYSLPNARQLLGGRFVAIWVLPIYLIVMIPVEQYLFFAVSLYAFFHLSIRIVSILISFY